MYQWLYKNNFRERRLSKGLTLEAMAKKLQLPKTILREVEGRKFYPQHPRTHRWKKVAIRIANFFHTDPFYIWGVSSMAGAKEQQNFHRKLRRNLHRKLQKETSKVLSLLAPFEKKVLKRYFGEKD